MSEERPSPASHGQPFTLARSYSVPFSEVWDTVLRVVAQVRGWQTLESDSHAGTMRLLSIGLLRKRPIEADVTVSLDELGQTRLEMRFDEPRHILLPAAAPGRAAALVKRIDRSLATRRRS